MKTITSGELNLLKSGLLEPYYEYMCRNPGSLLAKMYGCFSIHIENVEPIHLLLMENCFEEMGKPDLVYDLKGSVVDRRAAESQVKKDLDWLESASPLVLLSAKDRGMLMGQVEEDSNFLKSCNIMDYSLLVGVKAGAQGSTVGPRRVVHEEVQYSVSVIDYLQEFNLSKQLESTYKSLFNKATMISSVDPAQY